MAAPLKFKPYIPVPKRSQKPKGTAPLPKRYHTGVALPEACCDEPPFPFHAGGFTETNDQEDVMRLDFTGLDCTNGMKSIMELVDESSGSNTSAKASTDVSGVSWSLATQLNLAAEMFEATQCDGQDQGSVVVIEGVRDEQADEMSQTPTGPTSPAVTLDPAMKKQDDAVVRAALALPSTGTVMEPPGSSKESIYQPEAHLDAFLLPPVLHATAPAATETESLSLENPGGDDIGFRHWLSSGKRKDIVGLVSERTKRLLGDTQNGSDDDYQQDVKRPKLSSAAEIGASRCQPVASNVTSVPVDDVVAAHGNPGRLLPSHNGNNGLTVNECRRYPTRSFYSTRAQPGGPTTPVNNQPDTAALSSGQSPSCLHRDTLVGHVSRVGASRSSRVQPTPVPFNAAKETWQVGQCRSCEIFRAALLEALSLLQSPLPGDVSGIGTHGQSVSNTLKRRYSLRKKSMPFESDCEETSNEDDPRCMGEHPSRSENDSSSSEDDDSISVNCGSRNASGKRRRWSPLEERRLRAWKRRRWSPLEERRLRAWKRENKSESWIASKLNRTASAVKQQWRKMCQEE